MDKIELLPKRKSNRLKDHNYAESGSYFITICTKNRQAILSRIVGGDVPDAPQVELLHCGKIVQKQIDQLQDFYANVHLEQYVIMPNHIHMVLTICNNGVSRTSPPTRQHATLCQFVSTLKRYCNKNAGRQIWQRSFYDHVIRDQNDGAEISRYIYENPLRWKYDKMYVEDDKY